MATIKKLNIDSIQLVGTDEAKVTVSYVLAFDSLDVEQKRKYTVRIELFAVDYYPLKQSSLLYTFTWGSTNVLGIKTYDKIIEVTTEVVNDKYEYSGQDTQTIKRETLNEDPLISHGQHAKDEICATLQLSVHPTYLSPVYTVEI